MSEKPILFSTEMVQAILREQNPKTMTRRVVKWKPYHKNDKINFNFSGMSLGNYCTGVPESGYVLYSRGTGGSWNQRTKPIHCPYGQPDDLLWVKETWRIDSIDSLQNQMIVVYGADGDFKVVKFTPKRFNKFRKFYQKKGWQSNLFMPREAARIFLKVTNVRVERLQDITEKDIIAEGIYCDPPQPKHLSPIGFRLHFMKLWDGLNTKRGYGWDVNPWVWVIEFERTEVST